MLSERYEIGHIIGSGGMSEVYAAEDKNLGRGVAVKMLRADLARDSGFRERFRREAQNSGRLNHPNIVAVYDTGEADWQGTSTPYIVMERVNGRTLRDVVRTDGVLALDEAADILAHVADALQASHEAGIIHRDIKPANIMLTNTGQVKVMDFGIARALDDSTAAMTQTSAVIGTAQYLSPEQARGKSADARSDVYALGCVLYEAVTGRTPFEGETPFAVAYQHVQEDPTPPSNYIEHLSPTQRVNIDAVVLTAMAKHPADRYQSAWEMGEDLRRLARGSVTRAAQAHVNPGGGGAHGAPGTEGAEYVTAHNPETTTLPVQSVPPTRAAGAHAAPSQPSYQHPQSIPAGYEEEPERSNTGLKWLAAALAAILIGAIGFFAWDFYQSSQQVREQEQQRQVAQDRAASMVKIPEVANRPRAEVQQQLEGLGLLVQVNEEPSPNIKRGNVIRINPAVGSELQKNATVVLTVSSGKEITDVPEVANLSLERAAQVLKDAGLVLDDKIREANDNKIPAGTIISQNPAPGTQLSKGSKVSVTVSKGAESVVVSNVKGMKLDEARKVLDAQGLQVHFNMVDSVLPTNTVINVDKLSKEAKRGDTVTMEVSNGMLLQAPDLVRLTEDQARKKLADAGWTGAFKLGPTVDTPSPADNNLIAWSTVPAGQVIRKDQVIEIRKWKLLTLQDALNNLTGN